MAFRTLRPAFLRFDDVLQGIQIQTLAILNEYLNSLDAPQIQTIM